MSARRRRKRQPQASSALGGMSEFARLKLKALLPRLASDHDGEVLATVAAIRRMLEAACLDLHDLAALLTDPLPGQPPAQEEDEWRETAFRLLKEHGECSLCLTAWEKQFIGTLVSYHRKEPSASQLDILDNVARKVGRLHP